MEQLIDYLKDINDSIDFETAQNLIDDKILKSLDILSLISFIDDEFDVSVPAVEIVPKNFNSVKAMWDMIQRLQNE